MTISGSGTITGLSAGGLPSATVTQTTLATPVGGTGPAFSATPTSASQTPTASTFTKVTLGTEQFDTNSNFASSTFTPTVAGYYQINGTVAMSGGVNSFIVSIYKNGAEYVRGIQSGASVGISAGSVGVVISMNGSTDYVELYTYNATGGTTIATTTLFSGALVRAA
jgi:hypothetical protein